MDIGFIIQIIISLISGIIQVIALICYFIKFHSFYGSSFKDERKEFMLKLYRKAGKDSEVAKKFEKVLGSFCGGMEICIDMNFEGLDEFLVGLVLMIILSCVVAGTSLICIPKNGIRKKLINTFLFIICALLNIFLISSSSNKIINSDSEIPYYDSDFYNEVNKIINTLDDRANYLKKAACIVEVMFIFQIIAIYIPNKNKTQNNVNFTQPMLPNNV